MLTHAMQTQLPPQPLLPAHLQLLPELAPWAGWDLPTACHSLQCRAGTPQLLYSAAKCPPCSELAPRWSLVCRDQLVPGSRPNTAEAEEEGGGLD